MRAARGMCGALADPEAGGQSPAHDKTAIRTKCLKTGYFEWANQHCAPPVTGCAPFAIPLLRSRNRIVRCMANAVYHTGYGIVLNLTRPDLGHPELQPGLMEEILRPVAERDRTLLRCLTDFARGDCRCAEAGKTPWMFIRRQRFPDGTTRLVPAHLPITHLATPEESDKHKAMKERIARAASRSGLDVRIEAGASQRKIVNDVLVTGPDGTRIGWEAQYSPISASAVQRRTTRAAEQTVTPLWVTPDPKSELIDRAPWMRVDDVPWAKKE